MKVFKRVLCLTLAVLMFLPLLVACKKDKEEGTQESNVDSALLASEMPDDGVGFQDFGGREIRLLGWSQASPNEFEVDAEDTGTTLKAAVFARNEALKARLNVSLKWDYVTGNSQNMHNYSNEAGIRASAGKVDIFTPYSGSGCWLMMNGVTRDLQGIQNLRLEDPWWHRDFLDVCKVNGKLYFASGDISWTMLGNAIVYFFNKDILSAKAAVLDPYGVVSMYELVETKQWTIASMIAISKAVATKDLYGFTSYITPMDAFYKGCGFMWMEPNANGDQVLSEDQNSSRVNEVVRTLTEFFRTDAASVRLAYDHSLNFAANNDSNPANPEWQNGQALFALHPIFSITDFKFSELGFEYGVLPMPMYDTAQERYMTTPDFDFSVVALPRQTSEQNLPIMGAVLQVMASEGSTRIIPKYYDEVLKKQEADSSYDYIMMDLIRSSISMDGGRAFFAVEQDVNRGAVFIMLRRAVQLQMSSVTPLWEASEQRLIGLLEDMNRKMAEIDP